MKQAPRNAALPSITEVSRNEKASVIDPNSIPSDPGDTAKHRTLGRKQLINKLNHLNFLDRTITVVFKHNNYPRTLPIPAQPLPCHDRRLTCKWAQAVDIEKLIEFYDFQALLLSKDQQLIEVVPELKTISENQVVFILPDTCREISERRINRYQCDGVSVFLFQNGALFYGELIDYGACQFRIAVRKTPPQTYRWIDPGSPVSIVFTKQQHTLYSGECRIVKQDKGVELRHITLEPIHRQIRRFPSREFRSSRQMLSPSPDVVFTHPLFPKTITLKVHDISGSGFSVDEYDHLAVLLPGMIIPDLELCFSNGSNIRCMVQVVYSRPQGTDHEGDTLRCGITILDMAVEDHIKLLALLHQASDANSYLCTKVDMDSLWDFFFETGFIYPQKYEFIQANKDKIKATYEKLYHLNPSIAGHFIYQESGRILAHMAIVRFYEKSWLIHHHAAVRSASNRGGLMVLNQVGRFINDSYRLNSMNMDYVFCYFRPENKFPSHIFGGTARNINNPKICSTDLFAYFHHKPTKGNLTELPAAWQLAPASEEDLLDLKTDYDNRSGGLMLHGLHLLPGQIDTTKLAQSYRRLGLKRDRHLFALRHREKLCAIVVVNVADLGLNMSDLTSSVKLFVVHGKQLTHEVVDITINAVSGYFELEDVPVLLYPREAADYSGIDYEKSYCLWVYDTHRNIDHYYRFLKRLLKFIQP
ncbi:MAG: hypothetical protein PVG41_11570 [Desulfobacteraceae bacterium]|jgi:hypothetical protein